MAEASMSTATWVPAVGPGKTLVAFTAVFLPLPVISIFLRLWARQIMRKRLEFNDYSLIAGAVLAIANSGITLGAVYNGGVGRHITEIMTEYPLLFQPLMKMTLALALTWTFANTAVKLSILQLYYHIFPLPHFRWACYAVMGLTVAYCFSNCLQNLLLCRPIQYNWDKTINGKCTPSYYPYVSSASINLGIDIIVVFLPMPMLWGLHLNLRKKLSLIFIFGVGLLICALSAVRIHAIASMDYNDFSYSVVPDAIYSVLEPCLGVANACFPVIQPVISKLTNGWMSTTSGTKKTTNRYNDTNNSGYVGRFRTDISGSRGFQRMDQDNKSQNSELYPLQDTRQFDLENHRVKDHDEW